MAENIRAGKEALRYERRNAPLSEKIKELIKLQHLYCQIVKTRRPLKLIEKPWDS